MIMKSYNQFCALAYALDVVGERWTLLIIRELLAGPRRFTDLMDGLPGVSTNLLTERLKSLEQRGLVRRRTLPPPAGSTVYELTCIGRGIEQAVLELGRWGSQFLPSSLEGVALPSVGALSLAIKAFFRPQPGISETYELHLDDEVFQVRIQNGEMDVRQGQAYPADVIFHTGVVPFVGLFAGQITPEAAIDGGLVRIEGDPAALHRFLSLTGVQSPA